MIDNADIFNQIVPKGAQESKRIAGVAEVLVGRGRRKGALACGDQLLWLSRFFNIGRVADRS